jgi:16S rRNA (guanine527-N7)-methyltransferase
MIDILFEKACLDLKLEKKIPLFQEYVSLLLSWNKKINLIGRQQSTERIYHYHLLDCLIITPLLGKFKNICDIGAGAGFPGLCWALADDSLFVTLVEKSSRKVDFLTCVVKELNLAHRVRIVNERVENLRFPAELISCRALTSIADFLKITDKLGNNNSIRWLLKAKNETIDAELALIDRAVWNFSVIPLTHPTQEVTRNLVEVMRKNH